MANEYHKFTINDKEYEIKKMGLRDALWVSAQISNISATPIISLILDFASANQEKKNIAINDLNNILQYGDALKSNIPALIKLIADNFDLAFEIFDKMMKEAIIFQDGKKTKFDINDYSIDELDEIAEILIKTIYFNFETGLKKLVKKFLSLDLDQILTKVQEQK